MVTTFSHRRPCQGDTVTIRVVLDQPATAMYFNFAIGGAAGNPYSLTCMSRIYFPASSDGLTWEITTTYPYQTTLGFGYRIVWRQENGSVAYNEYATVNGSGFSACAYPPSSP